MTKNQFTLFSIRLLALVIAALLLMSCDPYANLTPTPTAALIPTGTATVTASPTATETAPRLCRVKTGIDQGALNLRIGAGIDQSIINVLREGQLLKLTYAPARGNWIQVKTPAGVIGWINSNYCKIGE